MKSEEVENLTFALLMSCAILNAHPAKTSNMETAAPTGDDILGEFYDQKQRDQEMDEAIQLMQAEESGRIIIHVEARKIADLSAGDKVITYKIARTAHAMLESQPGGESQPLQEQAMATVAHAARLVTQDREARILATQTLSADDRAALQRQSKEVAAKTTVSLRF